MKRAVFTLAAFAAIGLATSTAFAGHGSSHGRYYGHQSHYYRLHYRSHPNYRPPVRHYGSYSHRDSVSRIIATHSRYRYNAHPRSLYSSPSYRSGRCGW